MAEKMKPKALYYLKSLKLLEGTLSKRLNSLETLEAITFKIEAAATDSHVSRIINFRF